MTAIGILDPVLIHEGGSLTKSLDGAIEGAVLAEKAGYSHVLFAEHHDVSAYASCRPEILASSAAAATSRMRIGIAGFQIPQRRPREVAEIASLLKAMTRDRIDVYIGTAGGAPGKRNATPDETRRFLAALTGYGLAPSVLTTGGDSTLAAAEFGLGIAIADFLRADAPSAVLRKYRSVRATAPPTTMLALAAVPSWDRRVARRFAATIRNWRLRRDQGRDEPFPAHADLAPGPAPGLVRHRLIYGTPADVAQQVNAHIEASRPDALTLLVYGESIGARFEMLVEIARVLDLKGPSTHAR